MNVHKMSGDPICAHGRILGKGGGLHGKSCIGQGVVWNETKVMEWPHYNHMMAGGRPSNTVELNLVDKGLVSKRIISYELEGYS